MARPKKDNRKDDAYLFRMSTEDRRMIDCIQAETGFSIAEILRIGVRQQYIKVRLNDPDF